jgi:uncharacterized protein YbjQ (UPF0145 family)
VQDQDPDRRQPDEPSSDPWGLPAEPEGPAQWPEEERPEEQDPAEVVPEEETPHEEAPEEETPPTPPERTEDGWSHAEEQARPEAVEPEDTVEGPAEESAIRRGPLSQALAAAQSVITSLGGPPTVRTEESPEEEQESAPSETPSPHDLPDEPPPWMEGEAQTETEMEEEEEEEEEIVLLPQEGVFEDRELAEDDYLHEAEAGAPVVDDTDELVIELSQTEAEEEEGEEEIVLLPQEGVFEDRELAEDDHLHEAKAGAPVVDDTDELVRELSELAEDKVVEEIEVDTIAVTEVEPLPEPLEPAAEEAMAEEGEGTRAEEEPEPAAPEVAGEEADTTPAAYTELAASLGGTEPREEAASSMAPAVEWGALWRESAQGWVEDDEGGATWRPIVATTPLLSDWEVDTYLGVVAGETAIGAHAGKDFTSGIRSLVGTRSSSYEKDLARGRAGALRSMVDEAVARGAHAVIGVQVGYTYLGAALLVTASGTAVTLKTKP